MINTHKMPTSEEINIAHGFIFPSGGFEMMGFPN